MADTASGETITVARRTVARRTRYGRPIQKYMQKVQMWVWHSALFARHSHNYEKNILKIFANLLPTY